MPAGEMAAGAGRRGLRSARARLRSADPLEDSRMTTPDEEEPTDSADARARRPVRREHTGGVLGIGVGLLFIAVLFVALFFLVRGGGIDGEDRLAELIDGAPPFGLELADAAQLITGETVVRLERTPEPDADPAAGPNEAYLVEYPRLAGVKQLFPRDDTPGAAGGGAFEASGKMLAWEKDPSFEWHTILERGEVAWRRWRSDFVVERLFEKGGGWRDSVRVDLAQPGRFLVLVALWPPNVAFDREELEILLRSVTMHGEP